MIWILGGSGYIGEAIVRAAKDAKQDHRSISRNDLDYGDFKVLLAALRKGKPDFVINAAGFTGKPNVDACEKFKAETIAGNVTLALSVAQACDVAGIKLGTVSSGCIYTGAKILRKDGSWAVEDRLTEPLISELLEQRSDKIRGFGEADEPNFTFEHNNCSFYSGTKAVAEQALRNFPDFYVWRIRIPFDEQDGPRNYLSKVQRYSKVYQNWNSLTHRGEFARSCLGFPEKKTPGGVYNMTNSGYVSTREVVGKIQQRLKLSWKPDFWSGDDEFYRFGAGTPRSNCLLDATKSHKAGVGLRPLEEALEESLAQWSEAKN